MTHNARRRTAVPEPPAEAPSVWRQIAARRVGLGAVGVVLAAVGAAAFVWPRVADRVARSDDVVLLPDAIELRGQAPWVKADIRAEALRDASLESGLPLHDPELANRLARAFDMHPWVRQVVKVELRHPASAFVEVRCREPAAMVGVDGGLLAVDSEGVVLPSADFTADSAAVYPRLAGIESSPQGPEGARWGDPTVEEGAALAQAIRPEWSKLGLIECRAVSTATAEGPRRVWELVGADGRIRVFGAAPGRESGDEPSAAAKIARLRSLDGAATDRVDLRKPSAGA
jgi:hypothetical protein